MATKPRGWTGTRTPSALKRVRTTKRRTEVNGPRRSEAKTLVTKAVRVAAGGVAAESQQALVEALSALDRAAKAGAIHPNQAARRKSRLTLKVNAAIGGENLQASTKVTKSTGAAAAAKAAKARIAAGKAAKAKGAQTAAGKARAALSKTARAEAAAAAGKAAAEASTATTTKAPVKAAKVPAKAAAAKTEKAAPKAKAAAKTTKAAAKTTKAAPKASAKKAAPKA